MAMLHQSALPLPDDLIDCDSQHDQYCMHSFHISRGSTHQPEYQKSHAVAK